MIEKIEARNADKIKSFISSLPRNVRGIATRAAAEYIIGDGERGLRKYPPYKYITRKKAFGTPFFSDRQRRKVMAMIREGNIDPGVPHRTGNYQRSWKLLGEGVKTKIVGMLPHAQWPDRLTQKIGWRDIATIVASNTKGAMRAARAAVNAWLKSK